MELDNKYYNIVIERKRIKNIYFRIKDDSIYITCSRLVPEREINKLLEKNKKSLEKMAKKESERHKDDFKVLFLGYELTYEYDTKIHFDDHKAYGPSVDKINESLEKHALKYFQERMDIYTPEFNNLPKFRLRIRKMKTRWGVCNRKSMTVTLNSLLIHKKVDLIDYVICHELSHFEHMNHSAAFWKEVEKHYKDYKKARKELNS